MYGVFSQNKNPERLIHEHLFITIAICWFILVTNSLIKCKIKNTTPSQVLQNRQKLDPNTGVIAIFPGLAKLALWASPLLVKPYLLQIFSTDE
jgi:UDP-N-acetylmuramyl pentapeptide phosphotransferase/UDP-N-acetylglucosamine-1-phosphate transferase